MHLAPTKEKKAAEASKGGKPKGHPKSNPETAQMLQTASNFKDRIAMLAAS